MYVRTRSTENVYLSEACLPLVRARTTSCQARNRSGSAGAVVSPFAVGLTALSPRLLPRQRDPLSLRPPGPSRGRCRRHHLGRVADRLQLRDVDEAVLVDAVSTNAPTRHVGDGALGVARLQVGDLRTSSSRAVLTPCAGRGPVSRAPSRCPRRSAGRFFVDEVGRAAREERRVADHRRRPAEARAIFSTTW